MSIREKSFECFFGKRLYIIYRFSEVFLWGWICWESGVGNRGVGFYYSEINDVFFYLELNVLLNGVGLKWKR